MYRELDPTANNHEFALPKYNLSDEQFESLPRPAAISYVLETDKQLGEYQSDSRDVMPRIMELTGFSREEIVESNRFLASQSGNRSKFAQVVTRDGLGIRFELTDSGKKYLEEQIQLVGGSVLISKP